LNREREEEDLEETGLSTIKEEEERKPQTERR
jgi:hypothetical protein